MTKVFSYIRGWGIALMGGAVLLWWSLPATASAQSGFVTCGGTALEGDIACDFCHLVSTTKNIIDFLIGVGIVIGTIMIVVAGITLAFSGGNVSAKEKARGYLTNAIIGLIIMLAAWVIIDTIMRILVDESEVGPWNEITCDPQPYVHPTEMSFVREGRHAPDTVQGDVLPPSTEADGIDDEGVRSQFDAAGIAVSSSGGCSDPSQSNCTGLAGMRPQTVQRTVDLADAVGSENVVVTGGTETGHSRQGEYRHDNGYKVDLRTTPALNQHIEDNYTPMGGNKWRDPDGNVYYRHGPVDHWDVTVTN